MTELFFGWCLPDLPSMGVEKEHAHRTIDLLYLMYNDMRYGKLLIDWTYPNYNPIHDGITYRVDYCKKSDHLYYIDDLPRVDKLLHQESPLELYLVIETSETPQVELGSYHYGEFGKKLDLSCHKVQHGCYYFALPDHVDIGWTISIRCASSIEKMIYLVTDSLHPTK